MLYGRGRAGKSKDGFLKGRSRGQRPRKKDWRQAFLDQLFLSTMKPQNKTKQKQKQWKCMSSLSVNKARTPTKTKAKSLWKRSRQESKKALALAVQMHMAIIGCMFVSAIPKVSHKRVFTLIRWQPGSGNAGFCSTWAISSCECSGINSANTLLCDTLALFQKRP